MRAPSTQADRLEAPGRGRTFAREQPRSRVVTSMIVRLRTFAMLLPMLGCGASQPGAAASADAVAAVLDDWHAAAAEADEERYFAHFARDGVFLGTDATERWTVAEFRAYAHPHFERGRAWTMRATERHVRVRDDLAWFDEALVSEGLGRVRGSGVLHRSAGTWKILHYVLSFTIPNDTVPALRDLLAG